MNSSNLDMERAIRLFKYVKELSLLKTPLIRDVNLYSDVFWFSEIPEEPECTSPLHQDVQNDKWIEIRKPSLPSEPILPTELENWTDLTLHLKDKFEPPMLLERIKNPIFPYNSNNGDTKDVIQDEPEFLYLDDHLEIRNIYESFIYDHFNPWVIEFKRASSIQEVYSKLFTIHQKHKNADDQFELVVGVGLLNWKTANTKKVHRHLLTIPCSFTFDSDHGVISIIPTSDGIIPYFEQDMLEIAERIDSDALNHFQSLIDDLQIRFWNKELLDLIFRSYVQSISPNGQYLPEQSQELKEIAGNPTASYSPALILRKRSEKGFQKACSTIISDIEENNISIPQGIIRIFKEVNDYTEPNEGSENSFFSDDDIQTYFPLDANDEQKKIVSNLQSRNGVIVQGPPGTGKSHTIANLTSHLLATGKRILITSQTPRALKVLKNKIPEELQALCVSLLGADSKSFQDLESVVSGISNNRDSFDFGSTQTQIKDKTQSLKALKEKEATLKLQLRALRERETYEHHITNQYQGTAQQIAQKVNNNRSKFNWLTDSVKVNDKPLLASAEINELLNLLDELDKETKDELQYEIPPLEILIDSRGFKEICDEEMELQHTIDDYNDIDANYENLTNQQRTHLETIIDRLFSLITKLNVKSDTWEKQAFSDLINLNFYGWKEFYLQTEKSLSSIKAFANRHNIAELSGLPSTPLTQIHTEVMNLREHLERGKGFGIPLLRPKPVKEGWYIIQDIRVDGQKCDNLNTIKILEEILNVDITINKVQKLIESQLNVTTEESSTRGMEVAELQHCISPFSLLIELESVIQEFHQSFNDEPFYSNFKYDNEHLIYFKNQLLLLNYKDKQRTIWVGLNKLRDDVENSLNTTETHTSVNKLIKAIENRDVQSYSNVLKKMKEIDNLTYKNNRCDDLLQKVKTVTPILYKDLLSNFNYELWKVRFNHFYDAFDWAKANTWYKTFSNSKDEEVSKELNHVESSIQDCITELGSLKAWYSTLTSMTEGQRQHLIAWKTAMRKVGKGTGKNAPIHLKDAKDHMSHCRDAIPAWIMPLYQVFDNFEIRPNLFDVVIIDEASQSGPEAIVLQYIAKKIIVVGDDKQISPEYVGINKDDVNILRRDFLYDFDHGDLLDIETSFFDLANVLFGGRITLREHFRCMPEIIQFSNKISYSHTPLIPLRQYPPKRLEPIISKHVPNGYREGSGQKVFNRPEAEAIVKEIKECISHPDYDGKSFGVISLQSKGQAQLIQSLLLKEIGAEEMEKRNIICGDSYDFQGDERDIIFLSLVAAPGETAMRALTTEKDKRRFNVAVSRAKDQLWLFHTPTTNDFRNKECLRYQLISYCQNPDREILQSNREKCDSNFEKSVFDQLVNRGYRVIPQHEVAGYRIDLVVEGEKGRIAVECDGDEWHGPDRYEHDMNRQRILERCGWNFWRVRGSEYYFNPEQALESLWKTLDYHDIRPIGELSNYETEIFNRLTIEDTISPENDHEDYLDISISPEDSPSLTDKEKEVKSILEEKKTGSTTEVNEQMEIFTDNLNGFHKQTSLFDKEDDGIHITNKAAKNNLSKNTAKPTALKEHLEELGYEVIDKRAKGGALWIIGGKELQPTIDKLKKQGIRFNFAKNGSRSTKNKAAWFTQYKK
ncbi:AAA domain-containing protein [Bacillaceae bacterium S4-13-58]